MLSFWRSIEQIVGQKIPSKSNDWFKLKLELPALYKSSWLTKSYLCTVLLSCYYDDPYRIWKKSLESKGNIIVHSTVRVALTLIPVSQYIILHFLRGRRYTILVGNLLQLSLELALPSNKLALQFDTSLNHWLHYRYDVIEVEPSDGRGKGIQGSSKR